MENALFVSKALAYIKPAVVTIEDVHAQNRTAASAKDQVCSYPQMAECAVHRSSNDVGPSNVRMLEALHRPITAESNATRGARVKRHLMSEAFY